MPELPQRDPVLTRVARLYYQHDLTHQQIADLLGVSRVKVTRMLAEARRTGVVEIRVHGEGRTFEDLELALGGTYSLHDAWVVPVPDEPSRLASSLGIGAASALQSHLAPGMTVGVNRSLSVAAMIPFLGDARRADVQFVPLVGSRGGIGETNAHETAEGLARAFGGSAYHLPAPVVTQTTDAADVLRAEPAIEAALRLAARADIALVGIGIPEPGAYLVGEAHISADELAELVRRGAIGEISARLFDERGETVPSGVDDRVIGLSLEEHRAIRTRIAVAGGAPKREAIRAALAGGLVNVLVTDAETARWLVANPPATASSSAGGVPDRRAESPAGERIRRG